MPALEGPPADSTTDKPPRPRRWIPFSLWLFVAMVVIPGAAGLLWIGIPAYRQHVAIREIERQRLYLSGSRVEDKSLRPLAGFTHLRSLSFNDMCISDSGIASLHSLSSLEELDIRHTRVSDAAIDKLLRALPNLEIRR